MGGYQERPKSMKWEEPSVSGGFEKQNAYEEEAEELRNHPGVWAVITLIPVARDSHARSVANSISRGKYVSFRPGGSYEAVSRKVPVDDDTRALAGDDAEIIKVYARYVKGKQLP
jgi:hypothetical protein